MNFSKKLRLHFTQIAIRNNLKIDKESLENFKTHEDNSLAHELSHLRKTEEIRPGSTAGSSVNFLAILYKNKLSIAMNVATIIPDVPFTLAEHALISLAPWRPSWQDYQGLMEYLRDHHVPVEEVSFVYDLVKDKPRDVSRTEFLIFLRELL
jgi:hypothetical protein